MPIALQINRRAFLRLLASAGLGVLIPSFALAKDGDSEGSSGSGSGDSGGHGGDDGGGDDGGGDDGDSGGVDDSGSGSGSSGSGSGSRKGDQDKVKDAVQKGDAIPLSKALALLKPQHGGRVIEILYASKGSRMDYRFKILDDNGKVTSVTMDARTGRLRGLFGF